MVSQAAIVRSGRVEGWTAPDIRRRLQMALAGTWLLDALLQFQPFMFSKGFAQLLGAAAAGNPAVVADPISASARIIAGHPTTANATFAFIQLAIGLGIAWRPSVKLALGVSIAWSLAVWWFGEGLGGILTGAAGPVNGAPGAAVIYALLAVLLWPSARDREVCFTAARCTGPGMARVLWLVLWGSLAYLALQPATMTRQALGGTVAAMASGQPGWLSGLDHQLATFLAGHGPAVAVTLGIALALVSVSVCLPRSAARAGVVLAVSIAAFIWLAEGLGGILTGVGTDPNSGPLVALVALAYWPLSGGA